MALSSNKQVVAVGLIGFEQNAGRVRVFGWDGCKWRRKGRAINAKQQNSLLGSAVSISKDGLTLAAGAPNTDDKRGNVGVYRFVEDYEVEKWELDYEVGKWELCSVKGITVKDKSELGGRNMVSISDDGLKIAVTGHGSKEVAVWKVINNYGECTLTFHSKQDVALGTKSISLSGDGLTLAVAEQKKIVVYKYKDRVWEKYGWHIPSTNEDKADAAVSLSLDGKVLTIGEPSHDNDAGLVRVYKYSKSSAWEQKGKDITGVKGDNLGYSVSTSDDGESIAVGAPVNDSSDTKPGQVHVYSFKANDWYTTINHHSVEGRQDCARFGHSVSISGDGRVVAVGAPGHNIVAGYARIITLEDCKEKHKIAKSKSKKCSAPKSPSHTGKGNYGKGNYGKGGKGTYYKH